MQDAAIQRPVVAIRPSVRLVAHTAEPFNTAVASARTCYASEFVFVGRLGPKGEATRLSLQQALPDRADELALIGRLATPHEERLAAVRRLQAATGDAATREALEQFAELARKRSATGDRIAQSIYEAGHHTPFQHPTFIFALEDVSRNVVESFLHNHTFYNSEQQSQRYVEMGEAAVFIPVSVAADPVARGVFEEAARGAWDAYHDLRDRLVEANIKVMTAIGRIKGQSDAQIRSEAEKKAQEMARYVIPVAARTQLYHTVSGIVLLRYVRMCEASGVPEEARLLVEQMVDAVRVADPDFLAKIQESTRPRLEHVEWSLPAVGGSAVAARGRRESHDATAWRDDAPRLLHATPDAAALVADAVREVVGITQDEMADGELLRQVLDPGINPAWNDTLNTWDHSPVLRCLRHVHYTFRKRLSLTAYAQDQRHRLTPGTRPLLHRIVGRQPDVYVPDVLDQADAARAVYDEAIRRLWAAVWELRDAGIPAEDACYLLPNATMITFTQSGDLLSFIHKWRLRLCFNAQKEIFEASLAELRQVQAAHPELTAFIGPPCSFVAARQPPELQDSVEACCPEGPRWCGVKVWRNFDASTGKPKRPF